MRYQLFSRFTNQLFGRRYWTFKGVQKRYFLLTRKIGPFYEIRKFI